MTDIAFPNLPQQELVPLFQLDFANSGTPGLPTQRTLIVGQGQYSSPLYPEITPSPASAGGRYGPKSHVASMVERYLLADPNAEVWTLAYLDAEGATNGTGTITVTGTVTAPGTIALYVAGRSLPVAVTTGMTATQVAAKIVAAVTAYIDSNDGTLKGTEVSSHGYYRGVRLPANAASTAGVVTLTAENGGTVGNSINIRLNYYGSSGGEVTPAGITIAIAAMSGGAGDPDISELDAKLGDTAYDFIVMPWATTQVLDDMATMNDDGAGRWCWSRQLYGGVFTALHCASSTGSDAVTLCEAVNDKHSVCVGYEPNHPSPQWDVAAAFAGAFAKSSRADPARPVQTLTLPTLLAPQKSDRFSFNEKQNLLAGGAAVVQYDDSGINSILRAVTTYTLDTYGTPDPSYRDAETLYTLTAVVRYLKSFVLTMFPRSKLADDGQQIGAGTSFNAGAPDQPVATPSSIRAALVAAYMQMETMGLVQDSDTFAAGLIVQRNSTDASRVDVLFDPVLLSGLRVLGVLTQFSLGNGSQS